MPSVFKVRERDGDRSTFYYGKVQIAPGRWERRKLFRDKTASVSRLREFQSEIDQRAAGVITSVSDHASRPIDEHVEDYLASLRLRTSSADHQDISESMLRRLVKAAGWRFIRDMTIASVEAVLPTFGKTESYRNGFIKRGKAFASWLEDQGRVAVHPLRKLRRVSEKNATRTRARRAATPGESAAMFALDLPDYRRLAYAMAMLNGLRRNEIRKLTWDRIHLTATIPFLEIPQKNGKGDELDSIPLHPYVRELLEARTAGMPGVRVVKAVPDVKTVKKDWDDAGVDFVVEKKRLDFHAMRHTFQTHLDQTGCSRATKKRLMRHAASDVTDGYAHAELAEMLVALAKLSSTDQREVAVVVATGTDGGGARRPPGGPSDRLSLSGTDGNKQGAAGRSTSVSPRKNRAIGGDSLPLTATDLPNSESGDKVGSEIDASNDASNGYNRGPDTQVD